MAMGNEFKAASGREVKPGEDGSVLFGPGIGYLSREAAFDAEEYFQAKHDAELGRWRWPENPDYVVYPDEDGDVVVLNEGKGISSSLIIRRDLALRNPEHASTQAARAYFEAHPVHHPWHDAADGSFWRVIHNGMTEVCQVRDGRFEGVDGTIGSRVSMPVTHLSITDAAQMVVAESSSQAGLQSFQGRAS